MLTAQDAMDDPVLRALFDIQQTLGTLTGEVTGIKDHLGRLNGSVARHEAAINAQSATCAAQRAVENAAATLANSVALRVTTIEQSQAAGKATAETDAKWQGELKPAVYGIVLFLLYLVLSHAETALKFLKG